MNIATAGHVDHGKTSLVRALTQVDTDTLAEEKRRGLSIDLGFAYADFGTDAPVGFIDVPGHERFVRNMLAGVACIDLALIVIAADDGPMPQTRQHLAILELLGVPQAVVALNKIDRVDQERLAQAQAEVRQLLAAGPYLAAPIFPLVATDGTGVPALRTHLVALASGPSVQPREGAGFRLAIDRSFTLAGAGRIVTGAVLSGRVRIGDDVIVSPAGTSARVRGLHAQGRPAVQASAGQRCALNLAGAAVRHCEPVRGDWVVAANLHAPTTRLDARIDVLASEPHALKAGAVLTLHIGAAAVNVHATPLALQPGHAATIAPGAAGHLQLVLDAPVAALHGDRFVLRDPARQCTVGGGRVLDPFASARSGGRRSLSARLAQLQALEAASPAEALAMLVAQAPGGIEADRFALAWNLAGDTVDTLLSDPALHGIEHADHSRRVLSSAHWQAVCGLVRGTLEHWHEQAPDSMGPSAPALLAQLHRQHHDLPQPLLHAALAALIADGSVQRDALRVRLAGHRARLHAADETLLKRVADVLQPAGLRAPIVGELAMQLTLDLPVLLRFLQHASDLGQLLRIAPNRYYLPQTVTRLTALTARLAAASPDGSFDTAAFRDASGIGRNLSVQVLEFMDQQGLTRFDGTRRRPIGPGVA